ncbi:transcriptional regulator, LacI family [Mariniphaga anaerophila]|uniref:Transcriptional regulator, LacI family n=1 Tax=Mariniphaga anaerophila TaxID=1484053 RepID=A0A1M4ZZL6_9BACT|nr:substrate-binding domain-containing protein [Mariniphaga anaerophila]SHF23455.1 transcriptional regulator, LacI family [Mariniphaga anaerophila]
MKKTSLNDIAVELGVSKTLVSLVLNGKGREHRISEKVCKKVIAKAKELNYQPNQIAKGLRTGKTNTIGLIIADIANPFFGKLGREIENEASKHGYRVMFCSSDEKAEKSKQQIEVLQQGLVDGFIISPPTGSEEQILKLEEAKIPYVLVDRFFPEIDSNYIVVDNFLAAYDATQHLIKEGYKKIACVTINDKLVNMSQRLEGYKKALADANIEVAESRIKTLPFSHEKDDVLLAVTELAGGAEKADAVLFTTSKVGVMGLECIHSLGLQVPGNLAVVSFDDPDAYRISNPPVTAIAQPLKEIGSRSVKILMDLMNKRKGKKNPQQVMLKTNFVERSSSKK